MEQYIVFSKQEYDSAIEEQTETIGINPSFTDTFNPDFAVGIVAKRSKPQRDAKLERFFKELH